MPSSQGGLEHLAALGFTTSHATLPNGEPVEYLLPPRCDVPAGPFLMGSDPAIDEDAEADEQPQHAVDVAAFHIGTFPVTVAEYACFVRTTGHPPPSDDTIGAWGADWKTMLRYGLGRPMNRISWDEANEYAAWLTAVSGQRWRLPTEAEWEKAARWEPQTGRVRIYPWGNEFEEGQGRCNSYDAYNQRSAAIDAYPSGVSPSGVWDMAGNVYEWTSSLYRPYPYVATDGREDPHAAGERVIRGGHFWSQNEWVRAAARQHEPPDAANEYMGFRLARAVDAGLGLPSLSG